MRIPMLFTLLLRLPFIKGTSFGLFFAVSQTAKADMIIRFLILCGSTRVPDTCATTAATIQGVGLLYVLPWL